MYFDLLTAYEYNTMPVDRLVVSTRLLVHPDFKLDPKGFLESREIFHGRFNLRVNDRNQLKIISFDLDQQSSIHVRIYEELPGQWYLRRLEFNPGKILHGHNGRILNEHEVATAFAVVTERVEPLLEDPEQSQHVIPGCARNSPSYWQSLEIGYQRHDPDSDMLTKLQNMRHPQIRKKATHYQGESITLGAPRGELKIIAYRKDLEMSATLKHFGIRNPHPILRVEVKLSGKKLLQYLGNHRNIENNRVVRFTGAELTEAHQRVISELQGIRGGKADTKPGSDHKVGRFMGLLSTHFGVPLEAQLNLYESRFKPHANTYSLLRKAALDETSYQQANGDSLFDQGIYERPHMVTIRKLDWDPACSQCLTETYRRIVDHYSMSEKVRNAPT